MLLTYCRTFPVGSVGCWWSRCSRVAPVVDGSSSSWCSSSDDVAYVAAIASIRISRGEKKELRALRGGLSCEADSLLHIGSGRVQRSHLWQSLSHSQLIHSAGLSIVPGASSSAGSGADRWQAPAASSQQPAAARRSACEPPVPPLVSFVRRGRFLTVLPLLPAATREDQISSALVPNRHSIRILSSRVWIDPLWLYARVFRSRSCISFIVFFSSWSPWRPWRAALTRVFLAALMGIRALPAEFPSS